MNRRDERIEKDRIAKKEAINSFLENVDKLHNNVDSIAYPFVSMMCEEENNYINYYVAKHPNCLVYHVSMYKKDYPFNLYRESEYYKENIPQRHVNRFLELEKYFD